ncbi:glycosyltransferase family 2 protein [Microbacterium rhizosphaerae]|uniref:Glycosyltransferase n=1 Tax=Microbacterium rhizosphaerae TaxID=1678237 RepID=A0ABZ0SQV6_9MICO|nr:glycosyltransferase [Microbacterium rhizosphaerae]WPR90825.1 glycosyltransferase [Microbacterium rhizosphaerae]
MDSAAPAPVVDLCMPFWGDPDDLKAAVRSILDQTDPHWRLTVIDDCYPVDVKPFFDGIDDPRIVYRRNESNVGITENFRRAVAAATGPLVVVMGSDDLLLPNYVHLMRKTAQANSDVDIFQLGVTVIGSDGEPGGSLADTVKLRLLTPRHATTLRGEDLARSLLVGDWLYWPSLMFRTDTVRRFEFHDDLPIILDLALLLDLALDGRALRYEPTQAFAYRRHSESLSQQSLLDGTRFADERRYYRSIAQITQSLGWKRAARAAKWRIMSRLHGIALLPAILLHGSSAARVSALKLAFAP